MRTIFGIIAEKHDPIDFGFDAREYICDSRKIVFKRMNPRTAKYWIPIREAIVLNRKSIEKTDYWNDIKWIMWVDFSDDAKMKSPCFIV